MEIVYHLGVHLTDEDRLAKTLLRNRAMLAREGIMIPWPRQYRYLFREILGRLDGAPASHELQTLILDAVIDEDTPKRVVFGNENFLGMRPAALGGGRLYPGIDRAAAALRNVFPDDPVRFCLAVRNPATFLPALAEAVGEVDVAAFLQGTDPAKLRWSETIGRLRAAVPGCEITIWCDEDRPVLVPVILQAVTGHSGDTRLAYLDEYVGALMTREGYERMKAYFAEHPPTSEARRRRAVVAFLERFGLVERLDMEIGSAGWSEDYVAALTAAYDADIAEAGALPGVTLIA